MPLHEEDATYEDFVRFARFHLAREFKVLTKDPLWDKYTDEEILSEYYALVYKNNDEAKTELESMLHGHDPDIAKWFDKMIDKNQKELKTLGGDNVSFSPTDVLGE